MLITAAIAVGENALQSFAYFLYMFGIWDIFLLCFLKGVLRLASINSDMGCIVFRTGALGQPSARANYMLFDHDRIWMHYGASTTERRTHKNKRC